MTLIVMLILAGISLSGLIGEKGLFEKTENASNRYNEAKAREVLETVLLTDAQFEKNSNPKYNQDDFLDNLIKEEISGAEVKGDVAIIGDYAYELDRSVPRIGTGGNNGYLGNPKDLIWPTVVVSEPTLAKDYRTSTFNVTTSETKNGIKKIEIWLNGQIIEAFTKTYSNVKTEIKETFTVNKNGIYTVKVYGKLMATATTEVTGIVPAVEFSPNGNTEWKQQHSTKITVKETGEKVTGIKYKWTTSETNEPKIEEFIENCPSDNVVIGKDMTGTYYLWILLMIEGNKTNVCGSKGFNFDNENPTITSFEPEKYSESAITIKGLANDRLSGINNIKFYIDEKLVNTISKSDLEKQEKISFVVDGLNMGYHECGMEVTDISRKCI